MAFWAIFWLYLCSAPGAIAVVFSTGGQAPAVNYVLLYGGGRIQLYQGGFLQCYSCPSGGGGQSLVSIAPTNATFPSGPGSANGAITTEVAAVNPPAPPFAGTWSLSGTDASKFAINSATGALAVGPADVSGATYNVSVSASQPSLAGSPLTVPVTLFGQQIRSVSPQSFTIAGGSGTANHGITTEVAAMLPASPGFAGTWSLSGTDASKFAINSATGAFAVGPSDIANGNYSLNIVATQTGVGASPFVQSVTVLAQSILTIGPTSANFTGGAGSANKVITTEVATMLPVSPAFAGTWSLSGADASLFLINSATGVISVGPSDITVARVYNVTATATPTDVDLVPKSQAVALNANPTSIVSVALDNSSFVGNSPSGTIVGHLSAKLSGGAALTSSCANAPNTAGSSISCAIPKTSPGDTVGAGGLWCESGSCLTGDAVVGISSVTVGSQSTPCVEQSGSRAVLSQSGGDADIWVCPSVNGATNDTVTINWSSSVSYPAIYAGSFSGVVNSAATEGGNHFGSTSAGNFQVATNGTVAANDLVLAFAHRIGDASTLATGGCLPSPCAVLTAQPLSHQLAEYQILGTSGAVATNAFSATNTGPTVATIGALKTVGPSPAFSGAFSIATTGTDHAGTSCSASGSEFQIVGGNLQTNGIVTPGTYAGICVVATQAGLSNSPYTQAFTLTGSGTTAVSFSPNPASVPDNSGNGTHLASVSVTPSGFTGTLAITACSVSPCPFSLSSTTLPAFVQTNKNLGSGDDASGQTLAVTATPSSGGGPCGGGSPPPAAVNAGFSTCAFGVDFTTLDPSSNWITQDGSDTISSTGLFAGDPLFGGGTTLAANNVLTTDPQTGGQVLEQQWRPSFTGTSPSVWNVISTISQSHNVGTFFSHSYFEFTMRVRGNNSYDPNSNGDLGWGMWTFKVPSNQDGLEIDVLQSGNSNGCNAYQNQWVGAVDNFSAIGVCNTEDLSNYHTYGVLFTGNSSQAGFCFYVDNVKQGNSCTSNTPNAFEYQHRMFAQITTECAFGCKQGDSADMFVKSVRVWACPMWSTGGPAGETCSGTPITN